ncbi:hypothetical protein QBC46DRAFT_355870 [Diplogelasinospora grovesii]|uniref:Uncharacterized protein n=1 Tax=Diplogelasinospora grovesii TaxID=303347 RepID=A0AAN6S2R7_9PEZI|nr:hypothetical protein QBC46DRAFT_355870 [Diplogelasinospora grovesii]
MDSSKSNQQEKKRPAHEGVQNMAEGVKAKFEHHKAMPGPAIPQNFSAQEEGTKEERRAKAQELNK